MLQCGAMWCSVVQCAAVCCSVLQRIELCECVLQRGKLRQESTRDKLISHFSGRQCVAVGRFVLQCANSRHVTQKSDVLHTNEPCAPHE